MFDLNEISKRIKPLNEDAIALAKERQNSLVKPMGSLGALEDISIQLAGITGKVNNTIEKKIHFLFGADNGVYHAGVASSPQNFTNLLMHFYGLDMGCGINVLCRHNHVDLKIVDIGVIGTLDYTRIDTKRLMEGTCDFTKEKAMSETITLEAIKVGFEYAQYAFENQYDIIGTGEVGIANTTTAAAVIIAALGLAESDMAVGRGAGLTDEAFDTKKRVIREALRLHQPDQSDIIDILSKVGGLDIAALVGVYIGAAYYRIPIVIDGVISVAAALLAYTFNPLTKEYMIPSHISEEPAYLLAVEKLAMKPLMNLGMRLGEGTGCPMAMAVVENALAIINEMNTFQEVSMESDYRKTIKMK